jgi:2'-5' RNA ligase
MTTLPARMTDRWHNRHEPQPGEATVYWHILMKDHPQVIDLARVTQQRLTQFPELHMTPLGWLHITTLIAGPADHFSDGQLQQMSKIASRLLAATPPITVTVGGILYHPEAIMLAVKPTQALAAIREAVQTATRTVAGDREPTGAAPDWIPHITICYSTADQDTEPIIKAIGQLAQGCEIQVSTVSLIIQRGPERLWDWRTVDTIRLTAPAQAQP